jgi:hypothetical protein
MCTLIIQIRDRSLDKRRRTVATLKSEYIPLMQNWSLSTMHSCRPEVWVPSIRTESKFKHISFMH